MQEKITKKRQKIDEKLRKTAPKSFKNAYEKKDLKKHEKINLS